jgi:hypothetical protein
MFRSQALDEQVIHTEIDKFAAGNIADYLESKQSLF